MPLSVLVVEDDAALRVLFTALLTRQGFEVECVNDGAKALDRLAERSYSVLLLDLMMPICNGFDVLERFAAEHPDRLRQTIITTGVSERDLGRIDRNSVYAVLRKPFDIDELIATVRRCARQRRGARKARRRELRETEPDLDGSVGRLETSLPHLRKMLSSVPSSPRELLLRDEVRRVARQLAGVLSHAAEMQHDRDRAARYEEVGRNASRLAAARLLSMRNH